MDARPTTAIPDALAAHHGDVGGAAADVEHAEHTAEREPLRPVDPDLATGGEPDAGADRLDDRADPGRDTARGGEQRAELCRAPSRPDG